MELDKDEKGHIVLKMDNPSFEFDFFKLLLLSVILSQPKYFINKLIDIDAQTLYFNAKNLKSKTDGLLTKQPLQFHQFYDFI